MSGLPPSTGFDPARLIREHQAGVWRYLRALGCDPPLAEDLTQETFLSVLQRPFEVYDPAATAAYLRRVARNHYITHLRRRGAAESAVAGLAAIDAQWTRWAGEDQGESLLAHLRTCLEALGERARRAIGLRYREKKSRSEIAADLALSEHGAKNLLQRAKRALRECIERRMER
jgi:RNA polymerase sigma-70 factor, ECF subfamily